MPKPRSTARTPGALSKHQKFESLEIARSEIKGAPYNPRKIDEHSRKKLRKNLQRVGLIQPLVWNRTTGNLVGGHQRLAILDSLERGRDYRLTVAAVDLDEKTEREQNLFLNNQSAMGTWDDTALAALLKDDAFSLDLDATGFDAVDLAVTLDDETLAARFAETPSDATLTDELGAVAASGDRAKIVAEICKATKAKKDARDDTGFYVVVVFQDRIGADALLARLGLPLDARYVDGARVMSNLAGAAT